MKTKFIIAVLLALAFTACSTTPNPEALTDQNIAIAPEETPGAEEPTSAVAPTPETELSPQGITRQASAQQILVNTRINLLSVNPSGVVDGADARSNIRDTANGLAAKRSCYGTAPCGRVYLSNTMLNGILKLSSTYRFRVTSIAGGSHSATSLHYQGRAFDVDVINGVAVNTSNPYYRAYMQTCRNLGAIEVIGPPSTGHATHVHCAW